MSAYRPGACAWCPNPIHTGDQITRRREHGWVHAECATVIDQQRKE